MTRSTLRPENLKRDQGFSLVELSVSMVVLGIIAAVVSTFMVTLFRSEQTVQGIASSSNDSQVMTVALAKDLRNARSFTTTDTSVTASVSTPGSELGWQCVRWTVDPVAGTLARQQWPDRDVGASAGAAQAPSGVIAHGITALDPDGFFFGGTPATQSGSTTGTLEYRLRVATSGENTLEVSGRISNRLSSAGTSCWEGA